MNSKKSDYPITIVYTESGMCLTTKQFSDWRAVQAQFEDYKASLGPYAAVELVEYLELDYGQNPPFDLWDVRGLSGRMSAYMWAAVDSPPHGNGLRLGTTDGDSLRLAVTGFQFPDADDLQKRYSWYLVDGSATVDGRGWDFSWQALTCSDAPLICAWLFALADWVESRSEEGAAPAPPWLIEPNLQFLDVSWQNGRAHLTIELDLEFLPPAAREGRRGAGNPEVLHVLATADDLRRAAIDFAATIAQFPVGPGPSRPVSD